MIRKANRTPAPRTVTTFDSDTLRVVGKFKAVRNIKTYSEAMEKLIGRAERLGLHAMSDDEFDHFLENVRAAPGVKPELMKTN